MKLIRLWRGENTLIISKLITMFNDFQASQVVLVVKNPPVNAGDIRDTSLIPVSGRSPGGGHSNALQYSCLENPMDREARRAEVHGGHKVGHD